MTKSLASFLILSVILTITFAEPTVHTIRIRFPGASSDKIVIPKPAKLEDAPYPPAGFTPQPVFELPEQTYLPPAESGLTYGPPEVEYRPPAETYGPPEQTYGPPTFTYGPPENNDFQSAAIVNAPLTLATQFTPPRPNMAVDFRPIHPQSAAIVNSPLRPVSYLTLPRPERLIAFRPKRNKLPSQQLYQKAYLTLPHVERLTEFRPRRFPNHQQSNRFRRPLPASIFGNLNNGRSGRKLPKNIFSI